MNRKEQVIEIATRLFSEKGYENTSLSEVCEVAQVSKGLIFHHFKSKNDLLREIFSKTTKLIVEINETKANRTPKEKLADLLDSFFKQLELDNFFVQLNLNMILQPGTRKILKDLIQERSSIIFNSVIEIFREIDPENAKVLSYMLIAELDGIALNHLCVFEDYPLSEIKTQLMTKYL